MTGDDTYPPPPEPTPAPSKGNHHKLIGVAIGLAVLIGAAVVSATSNHDTPTTAKKAASSSGHCFDVRYQVVGPSTADVTYEAPSGTAQQNGVRLPWSWAMPGCPADTQFLYVSAQNNTSGDISCTITIDGIAVAANRSSGEYSIVTCSPS